MGSPMRILGVFLLLSPFAFAADDLAERTLKVWDTNKDGVLTKDEFPDEATFLKADRDKNGKVTRTEIAIFLGLKKPPAKKEAPDPKKSAPPKPPSKSREKRKAESKSDGGVAKRPFTVSERVKDFFKRFDKDKNRKVEREEAQGIGEQLWKQFDRNRDDAFSYKEASRYIRFNLEQAKRRPTRANFFELFDRNRDDRVTRREYDGPSAFFRQYDHNRNKVVTREELNLGPNAGVRSTRNMEADRDFMADGPTRAPERNLLDRYDADKDGRITLKELNGAEVLMSRLDRNGDGVLSGREAK